MSHKVTIATDSFKGSLSARQAAEALAEGVCACCPEAHVEVIPIADGGEGTAEVLTRALSGEWVEVAVSDPIGRTITAHYGLSGTTAYIDVAAAAGLTLLAKREPLKASTRGVGEMVLDALRRGARTIILGAGGSATTDCAMGLLEALGVRFFDADGGALCGCGASLSKVGDVDMSNLSPLLEGVEIAVVSDVIAPLYGPQGAAEVFAPQKGASIEEVEVLDGGLRHFARVVERAVHKDMGSVEGAGAAGGLAGGLWALLGADIRRGVDVVLEAVAFEQRVAGSDLIITGEGRVDSQTLMGKAPSGVLERGVRMGVPVVAVGGSVVWSEQLESSAFSEVVAATPKDMPLEEAMESVIAKENLRRVGEELATRYLL